MKREELPRRLTDPLCNVSENARSLLASAKADRPSPRRKATIRRAVRLFWLGLPPSVASSLAHALGQASLLASQAGTLPLWIKATVVVAVTSGIGVGVTTMVTGDKGPRPSASPVSPQAPGPPVARSGHEERHQPSPVSRSNDSASLPNGPRLEANQRLRPGDGKVSAAELRGHGSKPPSAKNQRPRSEGLSRETARANRTSLPRLEKELALLRHAKSQLSERNGKEALRALARYRERFPAGAMALEADAMTIEALILSGQRGAALARATAFLRRAPETPQSVRVRALQQRLAAGAETSEAPP